MIEYQQAISSFHDWIPMWWLTNYIDEKLTNCAEEIMINDAVCMCAVLGCVVVAQMKHSSASFSCFFLLCRRSRFDRCRF